MNLYLLEYAIGALLRQKSKNFFIFVIFTVLVFLLTTVFLITKSIRHELDITLHSLPQLIVQNVKGGKSYDIDASFVDDILTIEGVLDASNRVWGYYYFENAGVNFALVGIDIYEKQHRKTLEQIATMQHFQKGSMVVGQGVARTLAKNYYTDYFNFIKPDGSIKKIKIAGVFKSDSELESNDVIVMMKEDIQEIFDIPFNRATDIVVWVANPAEVRNIAAKIKLQYPFVRVLTQKDLSISYQNIFNYKSGVFLALFVVSLFTFFMIVYDKASGLSSEEKKEIGILKALGWKVDDILKEKFYEASIISFFSYLLGISLAFLYVYAFNAPLLRNIFEGYSQLKTSFSLPFVFDAQTLFLVFLLSVPIYIGAVLIPAWRVATLEADEVIR